MNHLSSNVFNPQILCLKFVHTVTQSKHIKGSVNSSSNVLIVSRGRASSGRIIRSARATLLYYYRILYTAETPTNVCPALIAQLGERQTEDLKAGCSIHPQSTISFAFLFCCLRLNNTYTCWYASTNECLTCYDKRSNKMIQNSIPIKKHELCYSASLVVVSASVFA